LIVTLTINPAIDRIFSVDRLAFEDRSYIKSIRESAGGRGINASRVIQSFGGETHAVLTSGGNSGKRLEEHAVREVLEKASWVMQEKLDYLKYSADLGGFPIAEDENLFTITT
jgi:fructose-1-phosphate kinase PfkB-like protein